MTSQDGTRKDGEATGLRAKRDGDLLRLYAAGRSQPAFAELRRRYARLVYSTCLREIGDPTLAEDAAQGVFLLLSQKAHGLERRETLADWLYTASRHVSRNLHKQERRRQMNEARAVREAALEGPRQDAADPLWEQVEPFLDDALGRLKPADREAVLLRFVQQQSLAEVGAGLGISENTARMRVQRSLEKIRAHLSRAGVAVTLALLAALLLEHAASAAPDALLDRLSDPAAPPEGRTLSVAGAVRRASLLLLFLSALRPLAVLVVVLGVVVGCVQLQRLVPPPPMTQGEQRRAFQTLDGVWRGSLEYADDRTGQQFTYPTTVTARSLGGGSGLSLVATYTGSTAVDRTTFTGGARAGTFTVTNGGPQSSHRLAGVGELMKLRGGGFAFQGKSWGRDADVRLRFVLGADSLTIQEEYRPMQEADYRFRNRFTLRRQ